MIRRIARTCAAVSAAMLVWEAHARWDSACVCGREQAWGPAVAGYDEASGRATAVYPPHLPADFRHVKLEITIPDMNVPKLTATETMTFAPIAGAAGSVVMDAKAMAITSVSSPGRKTEYDYDGKHLTVKLDPPVQEGTTADIVTVYELNDPPLGMIWTPESPAWPGRAAQIHTQGEPETNSYWFPCHDFPNDKLTSEVLVTLPAGYIVSSNGRLEGRSRAVVAADVDGVSSLVPYETWHWVQDKPHSPYLVSLVVGKFDVVDVGSKALPMPVYVPPGRGGDVKDCYGHTPAMIEFFSRRLEEPYPWDRYAQVLVHNFAAGGMENTGATTMHESAIASPEARVDTDLDGLISHELAHQWFGDLTTCNSWEHIWLNEGFATYLSALWFEHRDGVGAYQRQIRGNFDGPIGGDRPDAPSAVAMVSNVYVHPWEVFGKPANPYSKGSSVLHMLRRRLGDELFFKGVARFIDEHKFGTVETIDLRQALESVSGQSLEQFFAQWCLRPGVPALTIKPQWDAGAKTLTVSVTQTQNINGDNPAFEFDLPVSVQVPGEKTARTLIVPVRGKDASVSIPLPAEPAFVAVDPNQDVLAGMAIEQTPARWLAQLANGPTLWSRVQAVRGLRSDSSVGTAETLRRLALDRSQPTWLRVEIVQTLAARGADNDIRSLATTVSDQWEVRLAVVEALPAIAMDDKGEREPGYDSVCRLLADRAVRDTSTRVRASAIRALGQLKSGEYNKLVMRALSTDSHEDAIRQAALDAIVSYNQKDGLAMAMKLAEPGHPSRTRSAAIGAVGRLSHDDPEAAFKFLSALLNDRVLGVQRAAGDALVSVKDQRAMAIFEAMAAKSRSEEIQWQIGQWVKSLREVAK